MTPFSFPLLLNTLSSRTARRTTDIVSFLFRIQEPGPRLLLQSFRGHLMPTRSGLFPRNFKKTFPIASRGEGCWIIAADGRRFLDASGQSAVVSIGHGVPEIGRAIAEQSSQIAFAHTTQFHSESAEKLAARVLALAPRNFQDRARVYFTSGDSEATETAI